MVAAAASKVAPPLMSERRSVVKSVIFGILPVLLVLSSTNCFIENLYSLAGALVEQMNQRRIGLPQALVTRIGLMALAEHGDDLLAAKRGEHLSFRSGRFHHHDLGFGAVVRDREMLRPDAVHHRPAVGIGGGGSQRQLQAVRTLEAGAAIRLDAALEEIHRWRTDEAGDELVVRLVVKFQRRAHLLHLSLIHI